MRCWPMAGASCKCEGSGQVPRAIHKLWIERGPPPSLRQAAERQIRRRSMSEDLLIPALDAAPAPALSGAAVPAARQLPSNIEAEAAFLGAVLIDNRVIEELNTPLKPAHFFE